MKFEENYSSKIPVSVIKELHDQEVGFSGNPVVLGRLLKFSFGEKIRKQQDYKKTYCYYGLCIRSQEGSDSQHKQAEPVAITSGNQRKPDQPINPAQLNSDKVSRRALNLYRAERLEKNEVLEALSQAQAMNKYQKGLVLPNSLYISAKELSDTEYTASVEANCMTGSYGVCIRKKYRGMDVAVKEFHHTVNGRALTDVAVRRLVLHEANILLNLHSGAGIPTLIGIVLEEKPHSLITSFHGMASVTDRSTTVQFLLHNHLPNSSVQCSNDNWLTVVKNTAAVLKHIHHSGYVHNDLKCDNVIANDDFDVTIIDFGKSTLMVKAKKRCLSAEERRAYRELYQWIDPLVIDGICAPSPSSDIYALGYMVDKIVRKANLKCKRLNRIISGCMDVSPERRCSLTRVINIIDGYV